MENLFEKYYRKIAHISTDFTRSLMEDIQWEARMIGLRGARGIGKTTLLLQYMKKNLPQDGSSLYVSLDDIWFTENRLNKMIDNFVKKGGKYLFLDEVHKYPAWSQELKNAYDDYPELQIVFTGSSLLEILNARVDLSRRVAVYEMQGLSFREYLNMTLHLDLPRIPLEDILNNQQAIVPDILSQVKPLQYFDAYLKHGYYPFFREIPDLYYSRLSEVINLILEIELPLLRGVEISYISKLKQLLLIIAESAPFVPNVSKLSERIGINRATFISYLHYLRETHLIKHLYKDSYGISKLQKPDKTFLENTNLAFAFSNNVNKGNLRETFFFNQLAFLYSLEYPEKGDFLVDKKYIFEIGGKDKSNRQIAGIPENGYIVADDIEYGYGNKIPLWMFGFLY
jgi:predicted AAA+ superfamily ATPase